MEKKIKIILAAFVFINSFIIYAMTMAPTVSFWDCGEFVATAYTMGVPHPPGTPFFMIFGRAVIVLLPFVEEVAARINYISVISSAATVLCAFLFVYDILKKLIREDKIQDNLKVFLCSAGALTASFLLTFSDTFWFNAVEAEVYGIAMFFIVLICWLNVVWMDHYQTSYGDKLIVFMCYLGFLGSGMHLFSLLTLPVLMLVLCIVDPRQRSLNNWPFWVSSFLLYSLTYAVDKFPLISLGVLAVTAVGAYITKTANNDDAKVLNKSWRLSFWVAVVALIGYSTHAYIPIRSATNPIIDENNPEIENVFDWDSWKAFNDFVGRKQYGSEGMFSRALYRRAQLEHQFFTFPHMGFGGYQIAQYLPWKVGEVRFTKPGEYTILPDENKPMVKGGMTFNTQMAMWGDNSLFPALWFLFFNGLIIYICYLSYQRHRNLGILVSALYIVCTFGLIFYMNFADGTVIEKANYQQWLQYKDQGMAKPNPVHLEVRERDYFYTPAFIVMSLVFGLGVGLLGSAMAARRKESLIKPALALIVVVSYVVPCFSNYREHNRANLYIPWDYAYNLIMSCEPNSVLFTNGDNDTFPLWFIQEVEGIRKDVRVVNLSLGNTDWYISQMLTNEPKLKLSYKLEEIKTKLATPIFGGQVQAFDKQLRSVKQQIEDGMKTLGEKANDSTLTPGMQQQIVQRMEKLSRELQLFSAVIDWRRRTKSSMIKVQDKLVFDIVRHNPDRPIHYATTVSSGNFIGLDRYMKMDGMVYTLVRGSLQPISGQIDLEKTMFLVDSVYQYRNIGDGTAYVNGETQRLLSVYNQTFLQMAIEYRNRNEKLNRKVAELKSLGVSMAFDKRQELDKYDQEIEENKKGFLKYMEKSLYHFPKSWRNYALLADFYGGEQDFAKAKAYINDGLANADGGHDYFKQQLSNFEKLEFQINKAPTPTEATPEESTPVTQ